jgi:hypothetical protein
MAVFTEEQLKELVADTLPQIKENLTNHLYGENDYKAFSIVMRKRHEGD